LIENRSRLTLEIVQRITAAIGAEKVGLRISPFLTSNDMPAYGETEVHETYIRLAREVNQLGIAYLHISNNPSIPVNTHQYICEAFANTITYCNGFTAETKLQDGSADLVPLAEAFWPIPII
jgi:N-ethylmaleimide reductase